MKLYDALAAPLRTLGLLTLVCTANSGCGGPNAETPEEVMSFPESIGTWVLQESKVTYDRETIFDYINGAGEVYRSYAFSDVLVAQYQEQGGGILNVERFDMGTPEDAYGVFSYARENEEAGIGGGYETRGSVLCFWQDRFYVCVAVEPGRDVPGASLVEVARGLSDVLPSAGEAPELVGALPPDGLVPHSDRFFHTHQSLNYHYYLVRENILDLNQETDAVLARYQPGPSYLLVIDYGDEGAANGALAAFREQYVPGAGVNGTVETGDGTFLSSSQQNRFVVVVLDAPSMAAAENLRQATTERLTQLAY